MQKSPARPLYSEHSFVTWRSPLVGEGVRPAMELSFQLASIGNPKVQQVCVPAVRRVNGREADALWSSFVRLGLVVSAGIEREGASAADHWHVGRAVA